MPENPTRSRPVLVVMADPSYRQVVVLALEDLNLAHVDVPTWRDGVAWLTTRPSLAIYDLDQHPSNDYAGLLALILRGWGAPVPLIVISASPDVAIIAATVGATAGLRKPLSVPRLFQAIDQVIRADPP